MRKIFGALFGVAAITLSTAGVAQATAPPKAFTQKAVLVSRTTATLTGVVNAHGLPTTYAFNYGPTTAYGSTTPSKVAGDKVGQVKVKEAIGGLQPGTVYHFQVMADNASGAIAGQDMIFKTRGNAPSQVLTGPPSVVGNTSADVTGTINPAGATTTWVVQYGTTTSYGSQTFTQTLAAGTAAVPVQITLSSLSPETLFHYRLVSFHGSKPSYGADQTFFTRPTNALPPEMTTSITPKTDGSAPYSFTASGTLHGGSAIPTAQRCTGVVGIRYFNGSHQLGTAFVDIDPSCQFSATTTFSKLYGSGRIKLRVSVFYRGNGYLNKESKTDHPYAGTAH